MLTRAWILDILDKLPIVYWPVFFWEVWWFERYYRACRAANPVGLLAIGVTQSAFSPLASRKPGASSSGCRALATGRARRTGRRMPRARRGSGSISHASPRPIQTPKARRIWRWTVIGRYLDGFWTSFGRSLDRSCSSPASAATLSKPIPERRKSPDSVAARSGLFEGRA
jgi:hypothetical protein